MAAPPTDVDALSVPITGSLAGAVIAASLVEAAAAPGRGCSASLGRS